MPRVVPSDVVSVIDRLFGPSRTELYVNSAFPGRRVEFKGLHDNCPASGAARTSVRGAGIECDKQRRQGCAMTKSKHQVLCTTRRESMGIHRFRCPRYPSRLGLFAMDPKKPDTGARPSRNRSKKIS